MHDVDKISFSFLWLNKKAHVKKEVIINEVSKGGLKMPLFSGMVNGMKGTWVKRIMLENLQKSNLLKNFIIPHCAIAESGNEWVRSIS